MNLLRNRIAIVFLYIYGVCSAQAGLTGNILKVGDSAPSLDSAKWLKGEPVNEFKKGHIYVVDFGFIGCVPCMEGWAKMSRLQEKYKDQVTFVVVMTHSSLSQVEKYLDRTGDLISVPVAFDAPIIDGNIKQNRILDSLWVKRTSNALEKKLGYPTYYFIDKEGRIAHIGDATTNIEYQLDLLLGNNEAALTNEQKEFKRKELYNGYLYYANNYSHRKDLKYSDFVNALDYIEKLIKIFPENIAYKRDKFGLLLEINSQAAYNYGKEVLENYPWEIMNNAWDLAKRWSPLIRRKFFEGSDIDNDLAIAMCLKSATLSKVNVLEAWSYAYASEFYFMKGDSKNGEEFLLKAIRTASSSRRKEIFSKRLEVYKNAKDLLTKRTLF
ncbi:TlpA family protein disulfide reductase [Muricauda ruestringensis]|uniref:TlpA family protein disulfide reductase n=1 Tax=Flagellimonas aurea TaxID=2915619 RepID=A0ABS3G3K5_9FLAO|nr:TlpA disulfide reductase family protein [Allomuricauda aurea]MBO0353543.1 TlpA family protein disulfide reductase [Allomuricauda aurea]